MGDIQNFASWPAWSFGRAAIPWSRSASEKVTDREMSRAMERRLAQARQQNPEADLCERSQAISTTLLDGLIDQRR